MIRTADGERAFRLQPRRVLVGGEKTSACRAFQRFQRAMYRVVKSLRPARKSRGWGGGYKQRCIIRVRLASNRPTHRCPRPLQWAAHGSYIERSREKVRDADGRVVRGAEGQILYVGVLGTVFNATEQGLSARDTLRNWQEAGDPKLIKIVISPEQQGIDLKRLTRDLLSRVEKDLKDEQWIAGGLEWIAADHYNTDEPHVHVVLRAVSAGRPFRLPGDFVKRRIREYARDLCTLQLGYRTREQALAVEFRKAQHSEFQQMGRRRTMTGTRG